MEHRSESCTFLFSDIEASTRRWENDPDAMAADLAHHDDLLHGCVRSHGGEVFSHTGDGLCAVFPSPPAAAAAAVAIQLAVATSSWASATPVRVRIAVHTGPVQRRAGNYFGPTLNRTARLMSVGSGGQMLCSQAAAQLIGDQLPPATRLLDLGEHRLADLTQPERVFQVTHADLVADFPPLRSLGLHRHNLPVTLTPFVGRAFELKELDELLDATRLLTVVGAGGSGKTRLALQVAAGAVERFPDGVWIAALAAVRDESLIAPTLAAGLGLDTTGLSSADAVVGHLGKYLEAKQALLLFDNCEHLIDGVAQVIHDLLSRCPRITVVATSQEPLGLPEESAWRIPPLSLPGATHSDPLELTDSDAVMFFLDRVRAARRGFEITSANAAEVARICRRLDGTPLALELAAARVPVLGVHQVAKRLDDCFTLLTGSARTAVPRHQTLRATLDWSYELLAPREQSSLRRLSVFRSCFALDAAEAILAAEPGNELGADPLDLLSRLVDKSLVVVLDDDAEQPRYRLAEPVRQYARERLREVGEEPAALRRHRDFFVSLTRIWGNQMFRDEPADRVAADEDDFRAALEWSWSEDDVEAALRLVTALWMHWVFGDQTGAQEWFERIVDRTAHVDQPVRLEALCALAALLPGEPTRQQALMREAAVLAQRIGDPESVAAIDYVTADGVLHSGDIQGARVLLQSALSGFERVGHGRGIGYCNDTLGWVCVGEGDHQQARAHFERAAALARDHHSDWLAAQSLSALAALSALSGDLDGGLHLAEEAIAAARRVSIRLVPVMTLVRAGETALLGTDLRRAAGFLAEGLRLISELGTQRYLGDCLELVALTQLGCGEHRAAATMFGAAAARHDAEGGTSRARFIADQARIGRAQLADELGTNAFSRYLAEGHALPQEHAINRALTSLKLLRTD